MKNNNFWKNFIMAMVTLLATLIADTKEIVWAVVGITMLGNALIYFGKNYFLPSTSEKGKFNFRDILSSLIIVVGTALVTGAATFYVEGSIEWVFMGKTVLGVVIGYATKTLRSNIGSLK